MGETRVRKEGENMVKKKKRKRMRKKKRRNEKEKTRKGLTICMQKIILTPYTPHIIYTHTHNPDLTLTRPPAPAHTETFPFPDSLFTPAAQVDPAAAGESPARPDFALLQDAGPRGRLLPHGPRTPTPEEGGAEGGGPSQGEGNH